jgi:hypothetical protein
MASSSANPKSDSLSESSFERAVEEMFAGEAPDLLGELPLLRSELKIHGAV